MLCSPFGSLEALGPLLVPVNVSDQEILDLFTSLLLILLKSRFSDGFQAGNHFLGLISATFRAFLGSNTSALRGTLCEWQHASSLLQSKQAETQQRSLHPSSSHTWSNAPIMKDKLFLHLNLPTIRRSESRKSQRKSPLTMARLYLVWLSLISASPTYRPKRVMTTFFHTQSDMKCNDRSSAALATCFTAVTGARSTTAEVVLLTLCTLFKYRVC